VKAGTEKRWKTGAFFLARYLRAKIWKHKEKLETTSTQGETGSTMVKAPTTKDKTPYQNFALSIALSSLGLADAT
jgi:hypothetical protein